MKFAVITKDNDKFDSIMEGINKLESLDLMDVSDIADDNDVNWTIFTDLDTLAYFDKELDEPTAYDKTKEFLNNGR